MSPDPTTDAQETAGTAPVTEAVGVEVSQETAPVTEPVGNPATQEEAPITESAGEPVVQEEDPVAESPQEKNAGGKRLKRWLLRSIVLLLSLILTPVLVAEGTTFLLSAGHCHDSVEDCPDNSVGLVLGCSKLLSKGQANYYFEGRMDAAAQLWESGKVSHLIVSGDNSSRYYNEPKDMKAALVKRGVPEDRIICDYVGLRTYDSVMRARDTFKENKIIIVSQPEHVRRAVAIARFRGMDAEGYYAPLRPISFYAKLKQQVRERGARIAMIYDFITNRPPTSTEDKGPVTSLPKED